ncbi:MAG: flagellar biosynthesis anti-sigma factor FlgM [Syntrophomonadaceae bacterium]|jgi:negative regulator of flagellin synthesis FlgM
MMISKTQLQSMLKVYGKDKGVNKVDSPQAAKAAGKLDQLAISSESKTKQKAMQAVKQAPDIRPELISDLQERISTGTYTVKDDEVAEKMIDRTIVDRLV